MTITQKDLIDGPQVIEIVWKRANGVRQMSIAQKVEDYRIASDLMTVLSNTMREELGEAGVGTAEGKNKD